MLNSEMLNKIHQIDFLLLLKFVKTAQRSEANKKNNTKKILSAFYIIFNGANRYKRSISLEERKKEEKKEMDSLSLFLVARILILFLIISNNAFYGIQ